MKFVAILYNVEIILQSLDIDFLNISSNQSLGNWRKRGNIVEIYTRHVQWKKLRIHGKKP